MAHLATRRAGPSTVSATDGSRTIVLHDAQPREEGEGEGDEGRGSGANESDAGRGNSAGVLHLRGARRRGPRVAWTDDVVDNEGMGKKKSKICCIYHKQRRFDESSSESSSDSDREGGASSGDDGRARPSGRLAGRNRRRRPHAHPHAHPDGSANGDSAPNGARTRDGGTVEVHELEESDDDINAYERQPGKKKGKGKENAQPQREPQGDDGV